MKTVTYKVEQNKKYGDFRIVKYINNVWENEIDNNWNKEFANILCKSYNDKLEKGFEIF
jgi:hypothetical protein